MIINIQKTLKSLRVLDWAVGIVTVLVGLWMKSPMIIIAGVLGLAIAWINPAARFQRWIATRLFFAPRT